MPSPSTRTGRSSPGRTTESSDSTASASSRCRFPASAQARIVRITAAPDSSLWIQSDAGDLFHLGGDDRITRVNVPSVLATELAAYRSWQRLRVDTRGHVWINGWGPGLWRFDPATTRWSHVDLPGDERIVDFFFEGPDLLWLASERKVGRVALNSEHGTPPQWSPLPRRILFMRPHSPGKHVPGSAPMPACTCGAAMAPCVGLLAASTPRAGTPSLTPMRPVDCSRPPARSSRGQGRRTGVVRLGGDGGVEFPRSAGAAFDELLPRQLLFGREGDFWAAHAPGSIQWTRAPCPIRSGRLTGTEFLHGITGDSVRGSLWNQHLGWDVFGFATNGLERTSDLTRRASYTTEAGHEAVTGGGRTATLGSSPMLPHAPAPPGAPTTSSTRRVLA